MHHRALVGRRSLLAGLVSLSLLAVWFLVLHEPITTPPRSGANPPAAGDGHAALRRDGVSSRAAPSEAAMHRSIVDPPLAVEPPGPSELPLSATLRGTVTMSDGTPAVEALVRLQPAEAPWDADDAEVVTDGGGLRDRATIRTTSNGTFRIERICRGSYQLWIESPAAVPRLLPRVELQAPELRDVGQITLLAGSEVSGTVFLDGRPAGPGECVVEVSGERLFGAGWSEGPRSLRVVSEEHGRFLLPYRLYPSPVEFCAWRATEDADTRTRQAAGSTLQLELEQPHVRVTLRIATSLR